jgi:hypothetical protein
LLVDSEPEPPFDPNDYLFFRYRIISDNAGLPVGAATEWRSTDTYEGGANYASSLQAAGFNLWRSSGTVYPAPPAGSVGGALVTIVYKNKATGELSSYVFFRGGATIDEPFVFQGVWEFSETGQDVVATWGGQ